MSSGLVELFLLLFAEDIVSNTARSLQKQMNLLYDACNNLLETINRQNYLNDEFIGNLLLVYQIKNTS